MKRSVFCMALADSIALAGALPRAAAAQGRTSLTFAARQILDTLDPQQTSFVATRKVLNQMFDTLVVLKPGDTGLHPGLAESWVVAPDAKTYTLKLKRGVVFHDGTPLDAAAVKFTFDRIMEPAQAKGSARSFLGPYKSSRVIDEQTLRVDFTQPYAPFLRMLGTEPLVPISPAAVKKYGDDFGRNPVGTGPFIFKEWATREHVTMARNPHYRWAPPAIYHHNGPPYLSEIVWRFVLEPTTRVAVLQTGEAAIAEDLAYQDINRVKAIKNLDVLSAVPAGTPWTIFPNFQRFPTDHPEVRHAMLLAIDRDEIEHTLFHDQSHPSRSELQPPTPGYAATFPDPKPADAAKAKALLDGAGWRPGPDGIRSKGGKRLELLWIYGTNNGYEEMAPLVQAQLREIGMDVKLTEQSRANQQDSYAKGLHNIAEMNWWFPDPLILVRSLPTITSVDG